MRLLDRTAGTAALHMLAVGRRRRPLPHNPQRIGVIIPTAIGDTILGSGVLTSLADRYPDADLILFHGAGNAAAVKLLATRVTRVQCPFNNPVATSALLRRENLDVIVDLTPWTRLTAIYARIAAPVAIGFDPPGQHRGAAFDIAVKHSPSAHELDNHESMAGQFSKKPYYINVITERFEVPNGIDVTRLVLCHTCAGGSRAADKAWPLENWVELSRRLAAKGWQVGFTGASEDVSLVESILDKAQLPASQGVSLCGLAPLAKLGDLIRRARLLITIDTGVLHLAAAVDANILALHGPTRSKRWGARTPNAVSLDSSHPAAGYIVYGYERHLRGHETMLSHTVDDVAQAAFAKLDRAT